MKALQIVTELLGEDDWVGQILGEASVHLPTRGKIWMASLYGPKGQQWKSTGSTDKTTALKIAHELEAAARAQSDEPGDTDKKRPMRMRRSAGSTGGRLTHREVAALMKLSERGVRAIEKRALRKLAQHPALRELWRAYLAGELTEAAQRLSRPEVEALLGLVRTTDELRALLKVLEIVQVD